MKTLAKRKLLGFLNDLQVHKKIRYIDSPNGATTLDSIRRMMSNVLTEYLEIQKTQIFDHIVGYDRIKRTFLRSLNSEEPVHFLLVGPPGQAKTMFLKCILEAFGGEAFFTVGGNASKSGLIDVPFDLHPKYLLIDEIEDLRLDYQTTLLSLMETGILTQTISKKIRQSYLKTWVFATSNGTKRLSEPLLSRFRVMYLNEYSFSQFYEISIERLLAGGLDKTGSR